MTGFRQTFIQVIEGIATPKFVFPLDDKDETRGRLLRLIGFESSAFFGRDRQEVHDVLVIAQSSRQGDQDKAQRSEARPQPAAMG